MRGTIILGRFGISFEILQTRGKVILGWSGINMQVLHTHGIMIFTVPCMGLGSGDDFPHAGYDFPLSATQQDFFLCTFIR